MIQSFKSALSGIWIGSLVTFVVTASYLISREQNIDVPGEMNEALTGVGFVLLIFFSLVTIVVLLVSRNKVDSR